MLMIFLLLKLISQSFFRLCMNIQSFLLNFYKILLLQTHFSKVCAGPHLFVWFNLDNTDKE